GAPCVIVTASMRARTRRRSGRSKRMAQGSALPCLRARRRLPAAQPLCHGRRIRYGGAMTDLSLALVAAAAATFLGAGIVKGVTGMGLPTVAMGVLGALVSPLAAASLLIVPSFVTNVWQLLAGPSFGAVLRRLWPMMLGIAAGTMIGAPLLAGGDTAATTALLGAALVAYAGYTLLARQLHVPPGLEAWLSPM